MYKEKVKGFVCHSNHLKEYFKAYNKLKRLKDKDNKNYLLCVDKTVVPLTLTTS